MGLFSFARGRSGAKRHRPVRLVLEVLEDRRTPAVYLDTYSGIVIAGTDRNDAVSVADTTIDGHYAVAVTLNGATSTFLRSAIPDGGWAQFWGYDGDDWLFNDSRVRSYAEMGGGNDWAWTSAGHDYVDGGAGNDTLA